MTVQANLDPLTIEGDGAQAGQPADVDALADARRRRNGSLRRLLGATLVLTAVWFLFIKLPDRREEAFLVSGAAPDFEFTTFDGQSIRLADLRGQGVVVNFWASWCLPCRAEAGLLEESWRQERENGIVFLGLAHLDQEAASRAFMDEFDITYPTGPDVKSELARRYQIRGVPTTIFIDPEGQLSSYVAGPLLDEASLSARLDAIRPSQPRAATP